MGGKKKVVRVGALLLGSLLLPLVPVVAVEATLPATISTDCREAEADCVPTEEQCAAHHERVSYWQGPNDVIATCVNDGSGNAIVYTQGSLNPTTDPEICGTVAVGPALRLDSNHGVCTLPQEGFRGRAQSAGLVHCQDSSWTSQSDGRVDEFAQCTGEMTTHDGLELDARLWFPRDADGPLPVVHIQTGWGSNRVVYTPFAMPFVRRGYAVLGFSPRGFSRSCGAADAVMDLDGDGSTDVLHEKDSTECPRRGWTHIAERDFEVQDIKHLLGLLVDADVADPAHLAGWGQSYGAGMLWQLATSFPWVTPGGRTIQLRAAIVENGWTDFADAAAPNGRAGDHARSGAEARGPFGAPGLVGSLAFVALGHVYGAPGYFNHVDPSEHHSYMDRFEAMFVRGDPYAADEVDLFRSAMAGKSAYRHPETQAYLAAVASGTVRPVPILAQQGWRDLTVTPSQTLQMYRSIREVVPNYPIALRLNDTGHIVEQDPAHTRAWHQERDAFLAAWLLGDGEDAPRGVHSSRTTCRTKGAGPVPPEVRRVPHWDRAPREVVSFESAGGPAQVTTSTGAEDPVADPTVHGRAFGAARPGTISTCVTRPGFAPPAGEAARWRWAIDRPVELVGLPTVELDYALEGGPTALVAARLWDVAPDGTATAVTRGVYRLEADGADGRRGTLRFQLFGDHWTFEPGHTLELEVAQNDGQQYRRDNGWSKVTWTGAAVEVPSPR